MTKHCLLLKTRVLIELARVGVRILTDFLEDGFQFDNPIKKLRVTLLKRLFRSEHEL